MVYKEFFRNQPAFLAILFLLSSVFFFAEKSALSDDKADPQTTLAGSENTTLGANSSPQSSVEDDIINRFSLFNFLIPSLQRSQAPIDECAMRGVSSSPNGGALNSLPLVYSLGDKKILLCPDESDGLANGAGSLEQLSLNSKELIGKRVLSLGEGAKPTMVTLLLDEGVDAYGIDINEYYLRQDTPIFQKYQDRFYYGDATTFSVMPFAKKGFDHVLSSHLLCQLDYPELKAAVLESLRVLKIGGTARHIFSSLELDPTSKAFKQAIQDALAQAKKLGMNIECFSARGYLSGFDSASDGWHQILIFKKLQPIQEFQELSDANISFEQIRSRILDIFLQNKDRLVESVRRYRPAYRHRNLSDEALFHQRNCGHTSLAFGYFLRKEGLPVYLVENGSHTYLGLKYEKNGQTEEIVIDPTFRQFFVPVPYAGDQEISFSSEMPLTLVEFRRNLNEILSQQSFIKGTSLEKQEEMKSLLEETYHPLYRSKIDLDHFIELVEYYASHGMNNDLSVLSKDIPGKAGSAYFESIYFDQEGKIKSFVSTQGIIDLAANGMLEPYGAEKRDFGAFAIFDLRMEDPPRIKILGLIPNKESELLHKAWDFLTRNAYKPVTSWELRNISRNVLGFALVEFLKKQRNLVDQSPGELQMRFHKSPSDPDSPAKLLVLDELIDPQKVLTKEDLDKSREELEALKKAPVNAVQSAH